MPIDKCDLVIRHDEQDGRVWINALPSSQMRTLCRHAYVGFICKTSELLAMAPEQAERWIGRQVLGQLDLHGHAKIGVRDYEAVARQENEDFVAELERKAALQDRNAQFQLFQVLWNQALKQRSRATFERAESFLDAAAAAGHDQALAIKPVWPRLRGEAEQQFTAP
jgi:hypothetical protein